MLTNWMCLTHVKCATLAVQSPHYVAGANGLAAAHFHDSGDILSKRKVSKSANGSKIVTVTLFDTYVHDFFEEVLEFAAHLFVDVGRYALDAATARKTADVGLADALDVVSQDLPMSKLVCCYAVELLGDVPYLCLFAPECPMPRPLPATPRPPIPPIDVLPPVVFPPVVFSPPGRLGTIFVACCDLFILVLICGGMLCCIGCRLERVDQQPAEERGTFDDMDWQINATVATVTSLATVKGAMEGLAESSHLR